MSAKSPPISRRHFLRYMTQGGALAGLGGLGLTSACGYINQLPSTSGPGSEYDVAIYGGTPGGIMAAAAAARAGMKVALIEPTQHIGGMLSSGLGQTDSLFKQYIGGLAAQFYAQVGSYYGMASDPGYFYEPHVAESILHGFLPGDKVTLLLGNRLTSARMDGPAIQSIQLNSGASIRASAWIDASYEGDLMAGAGVTYRIGREAISTYNEPHAGWARSTMVTDVSALQKDGALISGVSANPDETKGNGDAKIMAYSFRCCLTTNPSILVPFTRPANYDPSRYLGLTRSIAADRITKLSKIVSMSPTIREKYDLLRSENPFTVNLIGGGWAYPEASYMQRQAIVQDHYNYVAGWLYFVANDPSIPASVQEEIRTYGLAKDEFTDNANWPYQLYIREARRMIGQYVMTEADITTQITKNDSIAIGTWYGDCHPCDLYSSTAVGAGDSDAVVQADGELDVKTPAYQIPYRCLLPNQTEANNLAVVCCPGSSHVGFSSLRVEPTFMMLGEAAGTAAGLCAHSGGSFSRVDIDSLQAQLQANGGILSV